MTRFTHQAGAYFVATEDGDGRSRTFKVIGAAGVAPLQQYLIETESDRLQALDIAWDNIDKRWYHLYGLRLNPDSAPLTQLLHAIQSSKETK